jgi:hypothetical protein
LCQRSTFEWWRKNMNVYFIYALSSNRFEWNLLSIISCCWMEFRAKSKWKQSNCFACMYFPIISLFLTWCTHNFSEKHFHISSLSAFMPVFRILITTRRFIIVFSTARHQLLSWANWMHYTSQPISQRSIQIPSSHLRFSLPSGLYHMGFRSKPYTLFSPLTWVPHASSTSLSLSSCD